MFLNAQSVRIKALDICDYIMLVNVDLVFLCETWLWPEGSEADCAALTPPGLVFVWSLFPDSLVQVVVCLFYIKPVLRRTLLFLLEICFYDFWDM